jgi:MerR family transcriptional regulator, light-induced transcriptional regulator
MKDMESLCDIKAHTLRIWEQRYRFSVTEKNKSQRSIYDNEDLKQLLRISFLYHNGWKISKIAGLNTDQIMEEVHKFEINSSTYKTFIIQMIDTAVDFNEEAFMRILNGLIEKIGFEKCITDVCYPFLKRIGMLWTRNNIIPAQRHFSSYIIQNRIIAETEKLKEGNNIPTLVLFSPGGEYHELPLLFIYYLLKKNGWSVIYLGVNINKKIIKQFIGNDQVEYLFLHLVSNFTGWDADVYFEELCKSFSGKKIIITGTAVHQLQRKFTNLILLKSDKEVYQFIQTNK